MIETKERYDYKLNYKRGPEWAQTLGQLIPDAVKILIVTSPIFVLILTVFLMLGEVRP